METKELIEKLRIDLAVVTAEGKTDVGVDNLRRYLDEMEKAATTSAEARRLENERNLAHYEATNALALENFRTVIDCGKEAINSAILINGGAVVVVMAFLGNAISKTEMTQLVRGMTTPLLVFGLGVLAGSVAFGSRYVTQFFYAVDWQRSGHIFNGLAWLTTISALCAFGYGVFETYSVVRALPL